MQKLEDFINLYLELLKIEQKAQIKAVINEIKIFSAKERESFGKAILNLKGKVVGKKYDFLILRLGREKEIKTEISSGDLVLISKNNPLKSNLEAVVLKVGKNYIEVALNSVPKWVKQNSVRVDLYVNDIVFDRMRKNLQNLPKLKGEVANLIEVALNLKQAKPIIATKIKSKNLNETQNKALSYALNSNPIFLIHGPPGTGKTTTLIEIIKHSAKCGKKVLATAESNIAVDNILSKFITSDFKIIRLGHVARVDEKLEKFSLSALASKHKLQEKIDNLKKIANELLKKQSAFIKPTAGLLRGMSKDRILTLAKNNKSQRGLNLDTIKSLAKWIELEAKINKIYENIKLIEREIEILIIKNSDIVFATNSMTAIEAMRDFVFDLVVIDEASQQVVPSTLLSLSKAKSAVIAGDHKQLPPTVQSNNKILQKSLFDSLILREDIKNIMLNIQYRMNKTIMQYPNIKFYNGALKADGKVENKNLQIESSDILSKNYDVVFINIDSIEQKSKTNSIFNILEAKEIAKVAKNLVELGVKEQDIGIITPYLAQISKIKKFLQDYKLNIETKSVDGFQGKEKKVILISFVRANKNAEVGFLKDKRRLNVALTRAKVKLIMFGNLKSLKSEFKSYFDWLKTAKRAFLKK